MTKESVRKCSHCGHNGHNSRTCNNNNGKGCSFKLFGVMIGPNNNGCGKEDEFQFIRKSKSMGNLQAACNNNKVVDHGYLSDGQIHCKSAQERKKGLPWREDEHRSFLVGLKKLGKGDWRGISKTYVPTRTPTQVASHAQKYFIRMTTEKRKRRQSVFDMHIPPMETTPSPQVSPTNRDPAVSLQLCTSPVSAIKNAGGIGGQVTISPPGAAYDRPPLSPVPRAFGVPTFCPVPYVEYPRSGDSFLAAIYADPSFLQVQNYPPSQGCVYPANVGFQPFANCASLSSPSTSSLSPLPIPLLPWQAAVATSVTKKEGLAAGIGALSNLV